MHLLPPDITVFERGWLSSNNILLEAEDGAILIDSGYHIHAQQTLSLVTAKLGTKPLLKLVNTHLHSDHCGGNAIFQTHFSELQTFIPPGQSQSVVHWDPVALSYTPTGQSCPLFTFDAILKPGDIFESGLQTWQIHAAPGHDPHSLIFFEPSLRILISADALWRNGFGVVFPEIEGLSAFDEVSDTLDLIESLKPKVVIPGHGAVFTDLSDSLNSARKRLDYFVADPRRHAIHAAKVLLKFKLLEVQKFSSEELGEWSSKTTYFDQLHQSYFWHQPFDDWISSLIADLVRAGVARQDGTILFNS